MQEELSKSQLKVDEEMNRVKQKYEEEHSLYLQYKIQKELDERSAKFEKEEIQRLIDLYKQSNESLETLNKRLTVQVDESSASLIEKE